MSNRIEIDTGDGVAPAFVFGAAAAPRVLMFHDGLGLRPAMHAIAERVAAEGYRVLLPDLFHRRGAYTSPDPRAFFGDPQARAAWSAGLATTTAAAMLRDTAAYLDHLAVAKVGVFGYCMGGRIALSAAATYPDRITAVGAYHPGNVVTDQPDSPHLAYAAITAEIYIGAATDDATFTVAQRELVEDVLAGAGVTYALEVYPARHGFVPADMPVHDAACADRHWETLLALFARSLR